MDLVVKGRERDSSGSMVVGTGQIHIQLASSDRALKMNQILSGNELKFGSLNRFFLSGRHCVGGREDEGEEMSYRMCVKSKLMLVKFQIDLIKNINNNNNKNLAHAQLVVWTGHNKNVDLKLHSTVHWSSSCSEQEFSILHSTGHPVKYILQNK